MKLRNFILFSALAVFLFSTVDSDAQRRSKYGKRKRKNKSISKYHGGAVGGRFRPYEYAGFNINALNYYGDLAPVSKAGSTDISFTRPGFGFNMGYKFNSYMALRGGLNWGRLQGADNSADPSLSESGGRYQRNLSFRNDIYELQLGMEVYILPNYGGANVRLPLNAYIFFGGALFYHNPKGLVPKYDYQSDINGTIAAPKAGEWVSLRKLGTEGQNLPDYNKKAYSPIQVSLPLGIGVKMRIPGTPFDAGLEVGYRFLFTDYIDDVSGEYVALNEFEDPLARIMSDRSAEPIYVGDNTPRENLRPVLIGYPEDGVAYYVDGNQGGGSVSGKQRGNPKDNDLYIVTSLKLTYILGSRIRAGAKFR
ncbi:MAG: hypothetical protein ABJN36_04180 [Cyclobacteriaceae bacterium]